MKFHIPSFIHYFQQGLPADVGCVHHHYVLYVVSLYPLQMEFVRGLTVRAVIDTFESPMVTPDGTEERSLIEGLLDPHRVSLEKTLQESTPYLKKFKHGGSGPGEKQFKYEYQIHIQELFDLIRQVRVEHDVDLIWDLCKQDFFVSVRYLEKKIFLNTGKAYSKRRINDALQELERQGRILNNGHVRTYGREVIGE